jgi:tetratricopeptide (TPR) repeat protein
MALGWALSRLGQTLEPDEGRATLAEAAELLERLGNHRELASAYSNVGYVALVQGRTDDALEFLDVAVAAAQKVGDPYTLMIVSGNVGLASLFAGDLERAENAFRRTLELCVGQTFSFGADEGLAGLSAIAAKQGLDERAARLAGAARKLGHNEASDPAIVSRLEHEFLDAANARLGAESWRRAHDDGVGSPGGISPPGSHRIPA